MQASDSAADYGNASHLRESMFDLLALQIGYQCRPIQSIHD